MRPHTVVLGNLARSVRDAARYYDVVTGHHPADPTSLPKHPSFEAGLGSHDLAGRRVAVIPPLGGVTLEPGVEERIRSEAEALIAATGMVRVSLDVRPPNPAAQWMIVRKRPRLNSSHSCATRMPSPASTKTNIQHFN